MKAKKAKSKKELTKYLEVNTFGLYIEDAECVSQVILNCDPRYWDCGTSSPEYRCNTELLAESIGLDPERLLLKRTVTYSEGHTVIEVKIDVLYGALWEEAKRMLDFGIFTFRSVAGFESKLPKLNFAKPSKISDRKKRD